MAPDKSSIMRSILAKATEVETHEIKAYVVEHQLVYSRIMKKNPMGSAEASTHHAHMNSLLDVLASEQKLSSLPILYVERSKQSNCEICFQGKTKFSLCSIHGKWNTSSVDSSWTKSEQTERQHEEMSKTFFSLSQVKKVRP